MSPTNFKRFLVGLFAAMVAVIMIFALGGCGQKSAAEQARTYVEDDVLMDSLGAVQGCVREEAASLDPMNKDQIQESASAINKAVVRIEDITPPDVSEAQKLHQAILDYVHDAQAFSNAIVNVSRSASQTEKLSNLLEARDAQTDMSSSADVLAQRLDDLDAAYPPAETD